MLTAHGVTHPGRVRPTNEDSLLADPDLGLYLVADGMGGHNAGEVASRLAVEAIRGFLVLSREGEDFTWPYGLDPHLSFQANRLMTAVKLANRRVFKAGESRDEYTGLGTTIVAALFTGPLVTFTGVGDSRIYLFSQGRFEQITEDDSWVATVLGRQPGADRAALASHPMRHVLTNVLGAREPLEMDVAERTLAPGDRLLLCSDGLHGALSDGAMAGVLASEPSARAAADRLLEDALATEAPDNITALVIEVGAA
ncbi:MAG: serine/threonine-protein phosphatase [Acidobacteria bacterium]|nr:serine/threonine-protein phosphatase [Acidobacteriota bacterium]